ncbi:hypothetical protein RM555_01220 [Micromonospora sp. DSM 115977]|uniref:WD40-like Beta Propeller Repeat n=1 Tax=Micromonospora reichwaldensis TaxID=3075516 RepID=A0ABU2WNX6_9ACTN|nr:hypothetical protein [Micromonospora sp. DSM 115977]MDT0527605.1 hypothetical protein [Micromonospora sp. DSM 115977]
MNAFAAAPAARGKQTLRRAVALSVAALVLLGGAACSAQEPEPEPGAAPAGPPAAAPADRPTGSVSAAGALGGASTLYYLTREGGRQYVTALRNGTVTRHLNVPDGRYCVGDSVSVSPDGRRVAWVVGNDQGEGQLTVANLDGSGRKTLSQRVYCLGNHPAWAGDSASMKVILVGSGAKGLLDLGTGRFTAQQPEQFARDTVRSASGAFQAYGDDQRIVVRDARGRVVHEARHGAESETGGFTVTGVSDDGRYVAVGPRATDPSRGIGGRTLVDMTTGRGVPLPVEVSRGHFSFWLGAAGAMVVRVDESGGPARIHEVSGDGRVVTRTEPASLATPVAFDA